MLTYFNSTEAGPSGLGHPVNNFYSFDSRFTKHWNQKKTHKFIMCKIIYFNLEIVIHIGKFNQRAIIK